MGEPVIAQKSPYFVRLEQGKYFWCSCGESKKQPFCDGTHKIRGEFTPVPFEIGEAQDVWLCGCKRTKNQPFCDGTHKRI
ncbi:MAG: CDGSH iron-sulfur domain-containing protein [Ignavibacteria bacterium]|nr:CDGSH iron-sulfur domain-containing protein [Ignavibacteria bacterium]